MTYQKPAISDLGSVRELTQQTFNKRGNSTDVLSGIPINTNGDTALGSFVNN